MPWLSVNQTRLAPVRAVPMPALALDVIVPDRRARPAADRLDPLRILPFRPHRRRSAFRTRNLRDAGAPSAR